jgi:predicted transcriptional regulator
MILTDKALELISPPAIRMKIALALGVSDQTVTRYIKENNDELTKAASLQVIREETGLTDKQILQKEKEAA